MDYKLIDVTSMSQLRLKRHEQRKGVVCQVLRLVRSSKMKKTIRKILDTSFEADSWDKINQNDLIRIMKEAIENHNSKI